MRITAFAVSALLAGTLLSAQQASQETKKQDSAERDSFATKWQLSKGGIGMVNKNLYIVVKSTKNDRNEVIVKPTEETEERWKGKSVTKAELAIVYEGKVWSSKALSAGFDTPTKANLESLRSYFYGARRSFPRDTGHDNWRDYSRCGIFGAPGLYVTRRSDRHCRPNLRLHCCNV